MNRVISQLSITVHVGLSGNSSLSSDQTRLLVNNAGDGFFDGQSRLSLGHNLHSVKKQCYTHSMSEMKLDSSELGVTD